MGNSSSYEAKRQKPDPAVTATLYYFPGRGLADQIRWMMAATEVTFVQKDITERPQFLTMVERQLPFGQLPLLQIDGIEIVQSQCAVRYLARRADIHGQTPSDEVKCDMIAETIRDLIVYLAAMPKFRGKPAESEVHLKLLKDKWTFMGARFEAILSANGGSFMVGTSVTYVDILLAHLLTWYVEECGAEIVAKMPLLVDLQNRVMSLPSVRAFIRSPLYYPLSGEDYMQSVGEVLGRSLK